MGSKQGGGVICSGGPGQHRTGHVVITLSHSMNLRSLGHKDVTYCRC